MIHFEGVPFFLPESIVSTVCVPGVAKYFVLTAALHLETVGLTG